MKILSLECSAGPASVAVAENNLILYESFMNIKLTHSQTLMPMVKQALQMLSVDFSEIDGFAVSHGPGSFTGVRIGVSALKGLAWPLGRPCVGVSSLEAMAHNFEGVKASICAVMDARCNQVYNALFVCDSDKITRITEDRAIAIDDLISELLAKEELTGFPLYAVGDGAQLFYDKAREKLDIRLAPPHLRYQKASGVALAALPRFLAGDTLKAKELMPLYLRPSQAERELRLKFKGGQEK
ncbi:MAG TPA: tRNA (adenosine(37)-N6)-threonylcarbamoyltransferase complex dimerization subunit type 1 TsaB [Clostridiales bacterium]|nr:tRNA (adenosine(37)-N6)-threonylcarbamoyltransferase complex dimerization subunit type 1 TsaB [Clostridiales bacterium]